MKSSMAKGSNSSSDEDNEIVIEKESNSSTKKDHENKENLHDSFGVDVSKYTSDYFLKLPDLGEEGGKISKWYKQEGELIKQDDVLCDIETELFTFGMDYDDDCLGIMGKILEPEGSDKLKPGQPLCIILHEEK
eukprot:CAMPEP_0184864224 /NCGR_PEP_ID=MMETSP0580-20130426/14152_1 /TAXON_ID=1118495 /ORGANISM="Dactyliosolen fragilissimus" /LENGTH=133 /DNA_ID=CAMNT_0027362917 /DNA_START=161 /DNA_END=562 /DNA_ORIENTATION=-